MQPDKSFNVKHQKFEEEPEYNDIKPADQSGDNDIDRISSQPNDAAKKETDAAYLQHQQGSGTEASRGRQ